MATKPTAGADIEAASFIKDADRDATPSNDENRIPLLEADGKLHPFFTKNGEVLNAGETLNGETLPVPVYQNKTDNELYACDANDDTKYKFIGFAVSNGTDGNPIDLQTSGIIGGFTGLSEGEKYYVQDTAGTIGTTPGTQEILVGIAISTTQLLIQKGRRFASGVVTMSGDTTITTGFRPSKVRIVATYPSGDTSPNAISIGGWTAQGGNDCVYVGTDNSTNGVAGQSSNAWNIQSNSASANNTGVVDTITDTGFTLNEGTGTINVNLYWEAEGEL